MRFTLSLLLLFAIAASNLAEAKPGPNTALRASLVEGECTVKVKSGDPECPPGFMLAVTVQLPSPGYDLKLEKKVFDREKRRIRIELRSVPKPGDKSWPQVIVPGTAEIPLGSIRKGRYLVEVHYAWGQQGKSSLIHATVLEGR